MKTDKPYIDNPELTELRRARREAIKEHGRQGLTEAINNAKIRLGATGEPADNVRIVAHQHENRLKAIANVLSAISFYICGFYPNENIYVWWDEEAFEDEYDFTRYKVPYIKLFEWLTSGTVAGQITCYHIQDDQIKEIDNSWWNTEDLIERLINGFFNIEQHKAKEALKEVKK